MLDAPITDFGRLHELKQGIQERTDAWLLVQAVIGGIDDLSQQPFSGITMKAVEETIEEWCVANDAPERFRLESCFVTL